MSASPFHNSRRFAGKRLHLGVCGSIACYKALDLLRALHARPVGCAMSLHTDDLPARQDAAALEAARALARRVRQQSAQQDAQEDQM